MNQFSNINFIFNDCPYRTESAIREAAVMDFEQVRHSPMHAFAVQCWYQANRYNEAAVADLERNPSQCTMLSMAHTVAVQYARSKRSPSPQQRREEFAYALNVVLAEMKKGVR